MYGTLENTRGSVQFATVSGCWQVKMDKKDRIEIIFTAG